MMEAFLYHGLEIIKAADYESPMNEIERLVKYSVLLTILALELDVRRYISARLDETYISPDDVCVWMLPSKFDGPYSCARSNV